MKIISKTLEDTSKIALDFLSKLKSSSNQAIVVLLEGDLGSGKTTFTQFLAQELGVKNYITSPTFVLMKKYVTRGASAEWVKNLIHIDAYRLNSGQDLLNLGWSEIVSNPANLIVVEWPEKVADLFTGQEAKINFKFVDEKTREIKYFL
jgi:tRNA threonylcarbamoyladenosine biosynthesis protein TsaE